MKRKAEMEPEVEQEEKKEPVKLETVVYNNSTLSPALQKTIESSVARGAFSRILVKDTIFLVAEFIMMILKESFRFFDVMNTSIPRNTSVEGFGENDLVMVFDHLTPQLFEKTIETILIGRLSGSSAQENLWIDFVMKSMWMGDFESFGSIELMQMVVSRRCDSEVELIIPTMLADYVKKSFYDPRLSLFKVFENTVFGRVRLPEATWLLVLDKMFGEDTTSIRKITETGDMIYSLNRMKPFFGIDSLLNLSVDVTPIERFFSEAYQIDIRASGGIVAGGFMTAFYVASRNLPRSKWFGDIDIFVRTETWYYWLNWMETHRDKISTPYNFKFRDHILNLDFGNGLPLLNIIPVLNETAKFIIEKFDLPVCRIFYLKGECCGTPPFLYAAHRGRMIYESQKILRARAQKYSVRGYDLLECACATEDLGNSYERYKSAKMFVTVVRSMFTKHSGEEEPIEYWNKPICTDENYQNKEHDIPELFKNAGIPLPNQ